MATPEETPAMIKDRRLAAVFLIGIIAIVLTWIAPFIHIARFDAPIIQTALWGSALVMCYWGIKGK